MELDASYQHDCEEVDSLKDKEDLESDDFDEIDPGVGVFTGGDLIQRKDYHCTKKTNGHRE